MPLRFMFNWSVKVVGAIRKLRYWYRAFTVLSVAKGKMVAGAIVVITMGFITQFSIAVNPVLPEKLQEKVHLLQQNGNLFSRLPSNNVLLSQPNLDNILPAMLKDLIHSKKTDLFLDKLSRKLRTKDDQACASDIDALMRELAKLTSADTWALHMVDAWGKVPSGIFSGNLDEPGDFLQCINLRGYNVNRTREIRGRYCSAFLVPGLAVGGNRASKTESEIMEAVSFDELVATLSGAVIPRLGTCFPASCSQEDIQTALFLLSDLINGTILPVIALPCSVAEKPDFDAGDYTIIILVGIIAALCVLSTIADVVLEKIMADSSRPHEKNLLVQILLAFSLYTNTRKWLNTRTGSDNLGCLHGMRFLSMSWVVLCHTWTMINFQPNANKFETLKFYKHWSYYPMLNGTPSVDTFFCMSGALLAYNLLREMDKTNGRFNYPLLVVHRFLRLTPTYIIIVGMMATILPYISNGPMWWYMDYQSDGCAHNWWHNMLYINNLVNYTKLEHGECYGEAWYLANDMQFFLLAPAVIYILWRWNKIGYGLLGALSLIPMISTPTIMDEKYEPPTMLPFTASGNFMQDIYTKPWTRCGPYIVGLLLGYILYLRKKNLQSFKRIPTVFIATGWMLSTALGLAIIFGPIPIFYPENAELSKTAWYSLMYGAIHRYAWGVVIAWIIFACVNGNGGPVNAFLSWKLFVPLGRLTFCMYISSFHMQMTYHISQQLRPMYISQYQLIYWFFGHMVSAGILGYLLMITLESPFIQLEKLILPAKSKPPPPMKKPDEFDANANFPAQVTAISINGDVSQLHEKPH